MERAMSFVLMSGRQGVPSLKIVIFFVASALATKSFKTKSSRKRGLIPQAVEKRKHDTTKFLSASGCKSFSVATFDRAYAVSGFNSDVSTRGLSSANP